MVNGMSVSNRIRKVYESAEKIPLSRSSRFIIMSDCHRGDGSWADDFLRNQNIFFAALNYYFRKGYTYIELGDGDELWENRQISDIMNVHSDIYWLLSEFNKAGRLYLMYGNHDIIKDSNKWVKKQICSTCFESNRKEFAFIPDIHYHEGLVLHQNTKNNDIFLLHGHQADFINGPLWRISRFLVRYLWRPLELLGVHDPTRTGKNYSKKDMVDKKLIHWVSKEKQMLIAGHTHRSVFPEPGKPPYFNDGCCVHPRCITGLEITDCNISLIKWSHKTKEDGTVFIGRDVIAGPNKLSDYWQDT